MSLFDDCNKTELTKGITAAACAWLDERGCKPVETEVPIALRWVADIASVVVPTRTELQDLRLMRRKPSWSRSTEQERAAWYAEVNSLQRMMTVIVEVKTSRGDFLSDKKWLSQTPANLCWLATPAGLIREDERPQGWGILEYSETRNCMLSRCAPLIGEMAPAEQINLIYAVAVRRDNQSRYEHLRRIQRQHRESGNEYKSVTRVRQAMRAAISIAKGEHGSIAGALEYHGIRGIAKLELSDLESLWAVCV